MQRNTLGWVCSHSMWAHKLRPRQERSEVLRPVSSVDLPALPLAHTVSLPAVSGLKELALKRQRS